MFLEQSYSAFKPFRHIYWLAIKQASGS